MSDIFICGKIINIAATEVHTPLNFSLPLFKSYLLNQENFRKFTVCYYVLLWFTVCYCVLLCVTMIYCVLLCVTMCYYVLLFIVTLTL